MALPLEMQYVIDLCAMITGAQSMKVTSHFGDTILRDELTADVAANGVSRWLIPMENDLGDELAESTENLINTIEFNLTTFTKVASETIQKNIEFLKLVYISSEDKLGEPDMPVEWTHPTLGTWLIHRWEPKNKQVAMQAHEWNGFYAVEQLMIISAEKLT